MKSLLLSATFVLATLGAAYAQEDSGIKFNVGGGLSFLANTWDQQYTSGGYSYELKDSTGSFGFNGFVDISQYFTINLGFRGAMGQLNESWTVAGQNRAGYPASYSNTVSQFELGAELKYPITVNKAFSWAPKIGLDYVGFLSGAIGGVDINTVTLASDAKQEFSPIYVTLGADLNFNVSGPWFIRVPLDLGFALNAKLSSAWQGSTTYTSSSSIALRGGLEVGYSI